VREPTTAVLIWAASSAIDPKPGTTYERRPSTTVLIWAGSSAIDPAAPVQLPADQLLVPGSPQSDIDLQASLAASVPNETGPGGVWV
jgi:hypothetical protein